MKQLFIGTSGWYYDGWSGAFYPAELPKSEWLVHYTHHFNTVEINASFYRLPFENMVKGWRAKAPKGFVYAVKGNRRITHLKKLVDIDEELDRFFERISGLDEHLGPILWQLPPGLHRDPERLNKFVRRLPEGYRHALEFRHSSWFDEEVFDALRKHGIAHVSVSSTKMPMDLTVTADFVYIRFHGLGGGFAHDYTKSELRPWAEHIGKALRENKTVFAYFNNDAQARAPKNAKELIDMANH